MAVTVVIGSRPKQSPETCNFIKKETLAQVFFCEFSEIYKNTFFTEHPLVTASGLNDQNQPIPERSQRNAFLEILRVSY